MNRTEEDLQSAFRSLVTESADISALLAGVRQGIVRRRRRRFVGTSVALTIAVLATLAVPGLLRQAPTPPATPTPSPMVSAPSRLTLSTPVRLGQVNGLWFGVSEVFERSQSIRVTAIEQPGFTGFIRVYEPGATTREELDRLFGYAWEYAPGAWAGLRSDTSDARSRLAEVAAKVEFGQAVGIAVPIQVASLPAGFNLSVADWPYPSAGTDLATPMLPRMIFHSDRTVTGPGGATSRVSLQVQFRKRGEATGPFGTEVVKEDRAVAGWPVTWFTVKGQHVPDFEELWLSTGTCTVIVNNVDRLLPGELEQFLTGLRVADCTKPSTWYDGTTAFPN